MKNAFYSVALCAILSLFASNTTQAQAELRKGNVLLNGGFGFGYYYAGGVPFVFSAEFAVNDVFTIGPYLGYTSYSRRYFGYGYSYSFIDFGVRGAYHFSKHINLSTDKLDLYGGALLGYVSSSYSGDGVDYNDPYGSKARFGIFGGARWYFTDKFAAYGEVGFGIAPLMLGVSFKL